MRTKKNKITYLITVVIEIIIINTAVVSIFMRQWKTLFTALQICVFIFFPFLIAHIAGKKKIALPKSFAIVSVLFIFFSQYLGGIKNFYNIYWWWDLLLHAVFGSYAAITAIYILKGIIKIEEGTTKQRFIIFTLIFAFCFSTALGTLWEMFEFSADYFLKLNMVKGGQADTATDLLIGIFAAFVTLIIFYYRESVVKILDVKTH